MSLNNQMVVDESGGVCLRKHLLYSTYDSITSGCTCVSVVSGITEDIYLGTYILPYRNENPNYTIDTDDISICLKLGIGDMVTDFIDDYINLLSEGLITIETRVIYEPDTGEYYLIGHTNTINCSGDTISRWAIVDYITEGIWNSGAYYYNQLDSCDFEDGVRLVKIKDINPISETFGQIQIITKCQTETTPILITNTASNITYSGATLNGIVSDTGGYNIIERGFCYSRNRLPSINDYKLIVDGTTGVYSGNISSLNSERYYHVRAFATNIIGVGYGNTIIFATNS